MAIQEDTNHQKRRCSCNANPDMRQSSLELVDELDVRDVGAGTFPHKNHSLSASTISFNQTSGTWVTPCPLYFSLNLDYLLSLGTTWTAASYSGGAPGSQSLLRVPQTRTDFQESPEDTVCTARRGSYHGNRLPGPSECRVVCSHSNQLT